MGLVKYAAEFVAALFENTPAEYDRPLQEDPSEKGYFREGGLVERRYRVKKFLCGTILSNLFLAEDPQLGDVVLKYCKFYPSLQREIAAFEKIAENGGHENIVSLRSYSAEKKLIVMPYYPEGDLYKYAMRRRGLHLREARKIVRDVGNGLQFMHDLGMVHRDIKTCNILLSCSKREKGTDLGTNLGTDHGLTARLADFGSCWFKEVDHLETGRPVGTMQFSAPEDLYCSTKSPAADVYSFGLVIYEMLAGRIAYGRSFDPYTRFSKRFLHLPEEEKIPPRIMAIIHSACEIKPENRPKLKELVDDFEKAAYF